MAPIRPFPGNLNVPSSEVLKHVSLYPSFSRYRFLGQNDEQAGWEATMDEAVRSQPVGTQAGRRRPITQGQRCSGPSWESDTTLQTGIVQTI